MDSFFAVAVHNDDLPSISSLITNVHTLIPCGANWSIIADIPLDDKTVEKLREASMKLKHVSVYEGDMGPGHVRTEDLSESPLVSYGNTPLDPFGQAIIYEVIEADWSNELSHDETVDATTARNLFTNGETVFLSVSLPEDMSDVAERLDNLDAHFSPKQSVDIHELI